MRRIRVFSRLDIVGVSIIVRVWIAGQVDRAVICDICIGEI